MLYSNLEIEKRQKEFWDLGVCLKFRFFKFPESTSSSEAHFYTAKNTLLEIQKDSEFFVVTFEESKLAGSEQAISLREFMGPYFDLEARKPLIRGFKLFINNYFYHDSEEKKATIIHPKYSQEERNSEFNSHGFAHAFLEPPYSISVNKSMHDTGSYFLSICDFLFSDLDQIVVYKWSTDCSNYFDDGKEWWGCHFWTVYNPEKDYYMGIIGSTTD